MHARVLVCILHITWGSKRCPEISSLQGCPNRGVCNRLVFSLLTSMECMQIFSISMCSK